MQKNDRQVTRRRKSCRVFTAETRQMRESCRARSAVDAARCQGGRSCRRAETRDCADRPGLTAQKPCTHAPPSEPAVRGTVVIGYILIGPGACFGISPARDAFWPSVWWPYWRWCRSKSRLPDAWPRIRATPWRPWAIAQDVTPAPLTLPATRFQKSAAIIACGILSSADRAPVKLIPPPWSWQPMRRRFHPWYCRTYILPLRARHASSTASSGCSSRSLLPEHRAGMTAPLVAWPERAVLRPGKPITLNTAGR